jgi:hypothetical protein
LGGLDAESDGQVCLAQPRCYQGETELSLLRSQRHDTVVVLARC